MDPSAAGPGPTAGPRGVPGAALPPPGAATEGGGPLERFLAACGADAPWHLDVDVPGRRGPMARPGRRPFVLVGRDPGADLVVDHWQVSRRHAYLQLIAGRPFCVDLGSRTGTHWEDGPRRSGWLGPGEAI